MEGGTRGGSGGVGSRRARLVVPQDRPAAVRLEGQAAVLVQVARLRRQRPAADTRPARRCCRRLPSATMGWGNTVRSRAPTLPHCRLGSGEICAPHAGVETAPQRRLLVPLPPALEHKLIFHPGTPAQPQATTCALRFRDSIRPRAPAHSLVGRAAGAPGVLAALAGEAPRRLAARGLRCRPLAPSHPLQRRDSRLGGAAAAASTRGRGVAGGSR